MKTVESLALLGATLCIHSNEIEMIKSEDEWSDKCGNHKQFSIPDCLPKWIRDEIRKTVGDYPEDLDDEDSYLIDEEDNEECNSLYKKKLLKIIKWVESELKELESNK